MNRIIQFLVHGNIYLSLAGSATVFSALILTGLPIHFGPMFIAFSIVSTVYNLNQLTDVDEDELNNPQKAEFIRRYSKIFLTFSTLVYIVSLFIAGKKSSLVLLFVLVEIVLSLIYSVLRLKDRLFFNNLIIGIGWSILAAIAAAFFDSFWTLEALYTAFFFGAIFFINTVIFDIKDIEGDLEEGVSTFPNSYGIEFTKKLTHLMNAFLTGVNLILVYTGALPNLFLALLPLNFYVAVFIHFASEEYGPGFYGIIVDGEFIFLALVLMVLQGLGL